MSASAQPAPRNKPIPLEEAQARLLGSVEALASETLPVASAVGRYLSAPIISRRTQPSADLSAMDGYAVRAEELAGPWTVVGESAAGHPYIGELQAGEAIRISTGALMPKGGGAVLLQENATREGDALALSDTDQATSRHIRRAGFDFKQGRELLAQGARLTPASIALTLCGGYGEVGVSGRPAVTIIDSGDELAIDPTKVAAHQIPASNGVMLSVLAAPHANVSRIGPVADTMDALLSAFEQASDCDVIVTSGGVSVGDHDLVRPALEKWGAKIDFWRIAIKPGKPLMVARRGSQIIIGLPGNPVSSYVTAFLFLLPLLRKLAGSSAALPGTIRIPTGTELPSTGPRMEFLRARMEGDVVHPVVEQDSSALVALSRANCLIKRPPHSAPASIGSMVEAYPLENGGIA